MDIETQKIIDDVALELNSMPADGDSEILHSTAERLLVDLLEDLGAAKVSRAFEDAKERVVFWYA